MHIKYQMFGIIDTEIMMSRYKIWNTKIQNLQRVLHIQDMLIPEVQSPF